MIKLMTVIMEEGIIVETPATGRINSKTMEGTCIIKQTMTTTSMEDIITLMTTTNKTTRVLTNKMFNITIKKSKLNKVAGSTLPVQITWKIMTSMSTMIKTITAKYKFIIKITKMDQKTMLMPRKTM